MIESKDESGDATLMIRIVPRAAASEIAGFTEGALKIRIAAAPVGGAANDELIKLLSKTFGVARRRIEILSGQTSKTKRVKISGLNREDLQKLLSALTQSNAAKRRQK